MAEADIDYGELTCYFIRIKTNFGVKFNVATSLYLIVLC